VTHSGVRWTPQAIRDLRRLEQELVERIRAAVRALAQEHRGDIRKLQDGDGLWRLRVGDYRVIFSFDDEADEIVVLRVKPRSSTYR